MKKYIYTVVAFTVFAVSALAYQSPELGMNMNIPFAFQAGTSTLPAGIYTVSEPVPGFLLIRGFKGGVFVPASALLVDIDESGKSAFKFTHAGEKYILQGVHSEK
jgi:hypothetical protein